MSDEQETRICKDCKIEYPLDDVHFAYGTSADGKKYWLLRDRICHKKKDDTEQSARRAGISSAVNQAPRRRQYHSVRSRNRSPAPSGNTHPFGVGTPGPFAGVVPSLERVQEAIGAAEVDRAMVDHWRGPDGADGEYSIKREDHVLVIVEIGGEDEIVVQASVRLQHF